MSSSRSVVVALAVSAGFLTACGKKEEAPTPLPPNALPADSASAPLPYLPPSHAITADGNIKGYIYNNIPDPNNPGKKCVVLYTYGSGSNITCPASAPAVPEQR